MVYDQNVTIDENIKEMSKAISKVGSGELTYSIRDTELNGVKIQVDDFIAIANGNIVAADKDKTLVAKSLLQSLINDDSEIVTIFYGNEGSKEEAEELAQYCDELLPDIDVEIIDGKQDIYSYIISVE